MDISKGFFISAATLFSSKEIRASPELLPEFVLEREAHTPVCVPSFRTCFCIRRRGKVQSEGKEFSTTRSPIKCCCLCLLQSRNGVTMKIFIVCAVFPQAYATSDPSRQIQESGSEL